MNPEGDRSQDSEPHARADVAALGEQLVQAIHAHASAVSSGDEAEAVAARAVIRSAMRTYSAAIDDAWDQVPPFPLPRTWREREGLAPRQICLQATYQLQVLDTSRLMDIAEEVSCGPVPDTAEATAALYGAQLWVPSEDTGLAYIGAAYGAGRGQA